MHAVIGCTVVRVDVCHVAIATVSVPRHTVEVIPASQLARLYTVYRVL